MTPLSAICWADNDTNEVRLHSLDVHFSVITHELGVSEPPLTTETTSNFHRLRRSVDFLAFVTTKSTPLAVVRS